MEIDLTTVFCSACGWSGLKTDNHVCVWSQTDEISFRPPPSFSEAETNKIRASIAKVARGPGAPQKASARAMAQQLRDTGHSYAVIAGKLNQTFDGKETGKTARTRTADSVRKMLAYKPRTGK